MHINEKVALDMSYPRPRHEADTALPLNIDEVANIDHRARYNRPVSRIEIRRLCATIKLLQRAGIAASR